LSTPTTPYKNPPKEHILQAIHKTHMKETPIIPSQQLKIQTNKTKTEKLNQNAQGLES